MIVEKGKLKNALGKVSAFVTKDSNAAIGMSSKVRFEAKGGNVKLVAFDGSNLVVHEFKTGDTSELGFVCDYRSLLASTLMRGDVTVEYGDGCVTMSEGDTNMVYPAVDAEAMQYKELKKPTDGICLLGAEIKRLVGKVSYARNEKDTRAFITCVNLICKGGELKAVATDACRMITNTIPISDGSEEFNVAIGDKTLKAIDCLCDEEEVCLSVGKTAISFYSESLKVSTPLVSIEYPSCEKFFQMEGVAEFTLDKSQVMESLAIMTTSENKGLSISKQGEKVKLSLKDGICDIVDLIPMEGFKGEDFSFACDIDKFKDIFVNIKDGCKKVKFTFGGPAMQILVADEESMRGCFMPLR